MVTKKQQDIYDIIIIGAGVVGSAIARECSRYRLRTCVLEKETDFCEGISKANSGVLHAGFNVKPGSLKAKLNVEGLNCYPMLAEDLGIEYLLCKKLVVAKNNQEKKHLEHLLKQGNKNGCSGLSIINKKQM